MSLRGNAGLSELAGLSFPLGKAEDKAREGGSLALGSSIFNDMSH